MGRRDGHWGASQATWAGQGLRSAEKGRRPGHQAWSHRGHCHTWRRWQRQNCPLPCGTVQMPTPRPEKQASCSSLRWTHRPQSPTCLPIIGRPGTLGQRPGTGLPCPSGTARSASTIDSCPTTGSLDQDVGGAPEPTEAGASRASRGYHTGEERSVGCRWPACTASQKGRDIVILSWALHGGSRDLNTQTLQ